MYYNIISLGMLSADLCNKEVKDYLVHLEEEL